MKKADLEKLKKNLAELSEFLKPVYEKIEDYTRMEFRTPDEEKELEQLLQLVKEATPIFGAAADIFGNEAFINATAYYNSLKQHAEKGDELAQKIYKELAPLYEQALLSQINKN